MRKLFSVPAVLTLVASGLYAQELPSGATDSRIEWDGTAEVYWKVFAPNGPSDAFNVDMDANNHDIRVVGMGMTMLNTGAVNAPAAGVIGIFLDNLGVDPTGNTPDLGNSLSFKVSPLDVDPGVDNDIYDIPDVTIASSLNTHLVHRGAPGDSTIWLGSDTNGPQFGNSGFTTDGYSTPTIPFTVNFVMGVEGIPTTCPTFWANGGTSTTISEEDDVCFLFNGCCAGQPLMIFLSTCGGSIILPAINVVFFTGLGSVDDLGRTFSFCAQWPCDVVPTPITLCFRCIYRECPPAKKILISNEVSITVNEGCLPCFGQKDDGVLDANIWKVQNPAGSADYFNVEQGDPASAGASTLTSVDVASWNFCATPAPWDEVGIYDSNLTLDPTGGTPALPALAAVNGQNVPAAQSDWGYPATNYDHADYVVAGGENIHSATKWPSGDSCVWIGSDTTGSSPCADLSGASSYFTLDGYNTTAISFAGAAWMMKVIWQ